MKQIGTAIPGTPPSTACTTKSNAEESSARARKCQKILFSAYRLDQYVDPEGFMMQVAAVFSQHCDATLERATDPLNPHSIQREHKWPPSIAEISDAPDKPSESSTDLSKAATRTVQSVPDFVPLPNDLHDHKRLIAATRHITARPRGRRRARKPFVAYHRCGVRRTPEEQARVDAQVGDARARLGAPEQKRQQPSKVIAIAG